MRVAELQLELLLRAPQVVDLAAELGGVGARRRRRRRRRHAHARARAHLLARGGERALEPTDLVLLDALPPLELALGVAREAARASSSARSDSACPSASPSCSSCASAAALSTAPAMSRRGEVPEPPATLRRSTCWPRASTRSRSCSCWPRRMPRSSVCARRAAAASARSSNASRASCSSYSHQDFRLLAGDARELERRETEEPALEGGARGPMRRPSEEPGVRTGGGRAGCDPFFGFDPGAVRVSRATSRSLRRLLAQDFRVRAASTTRGRRRRHDLRPDAGAAAGTTGAARPRIAASMWWSARCGPFFVAHAHL